MNYDAIRFRSAGRFVSEGEWTHSTRVIDSWELIYVLAGEVHLAQEESCCSLRPGELLCLSPGKRHRGTAPSRDTSFYWLHLTGLTEPPFFQLDTGGEHQLELLFRQLLHFANTPRTEPLALDYLTRLILIEAIAVRERSTVANRSLLTAAEEYIRTHPDRPLKAGEVAAACGYNPDYLSRLMKAAHGVSLKAYLDQARIGRARSLLLSTDLPLKEVARRCGFEDYKYFLKFFTYHEGMSPTALRNTCCYTHINHS